MRRCADAGCRLPMSKIISISIKLYTPLFVCHQPSARRHCLLYTRWRFRFVGTWSLTKPNRWTLQALLPGIPPLPSFRAEVYVAPVSFTMSEEESKNTTRFRRTGRYQADPTHRTRNETTSDSAQPMHRRRCSSSFRRLRRHLMPLSGQLNE